MRRLKTVIAAHQEALGKHPLFERLEASRSAASLARLARALAWWPMTFQDVLRLNLARIEDPALRRYAEHHRAEDGGHDRWFLGDLRALGVNAPGLGELFGGAFQPIRDASFALVAEVCREQSDAERVALLLALEPTGHVFFDRVAAAAERLCPELPLRYFGKHHLDVEHDHELFEAGTGAEIEEVPLSDTERARAEAAVARIYRTFSDIFSYLADRMSDADPAAVGGARAA